MNSLEKAVAILTKIRHEYPAIFHAFELDKVLEYILDNGKT